MSIEQIVEVPENGQVTIQLPSQLTKNKRVKIVIEEIDEDREKKLALLKQAANDPLFLADMEEVARDFDGIESRVEE